MVFIVFFSESEGRLTLVLLYTWSDGVVDEVDGISDGNGPQCMHSDDGWFEGYCFDGLIVLNVVSFVMVISLIGSQWFAVNINVDRVQEP